MQREATAMTAPKPGELLNEVQYKHDEVVITKAGKPVAAMIDIALDKSLKQDSDDFERLGQVFLRGFEAAPKTKSWTKLPQWSKRHAVTSHAKKATGQAAVKLLLDPNVIVFQPA
ncbi:MAG: type II toxin-antitoxin system prevent-host-death family antitoxin [Rhodoferax sp.]|nr:type II toxin-antitoxin system prevent-host-death family antitoxin [Rhodoferax sp.]